MRLSWHTNRHTETPVTWAIAKGLSGSGTLPSASFASKAKTLFAIRTSSERRARVAVKGLAHEDVSAQSNGS